MKQVIAVLVLLAGANALAGAGKGQRAPEFALPSLKGQRVSLASLRGKVVVVDFWAQWCEPCKKELPQLEKLSREWASRGAVVVAVSIDKQRENAERLVTQLGLTMPVLLDPSGSVAAAYELPKMPSSFVIDKRGIVRFIHEGFDGDGDVAKFRTEVDQLLR